MKKKMRYSLIPGTLGLMIVLNSGVAYATEDDLSNSIVDNTETDGEKTFTSPELEKETKYTPYETEVNYSDELAYGDYRVEQEGVLGKI